MKGVIPGESRRLSARLAGLLKKRLTLQWRYPERAGGLPPPPK